MAAEYDFYHHHGLTIPRARFVRKGLSGLINLGNKCFLNSTLQCLSNTLKLTDYFLSNKYTADDPEWSNKRKPEYFVVASYAHLIMNMWETNQLIKPKSFVENISKFVKKYFSLQQQDSHECLMYTLDLLHKGMSYEIEVDILGEVKNETDALMKKALEQWKTFYEKQYSFIVEIFNGMLYNKIQCSNCPFQEDVFEPYNCISLEVPADESNLETCITNFFLDKESIVSWKCEKCQKHGCTKNTKFWSLPNYIIVHLKRFSNTGEKIATHVQYPVDDLCLTPFVSSDKKDPNNYIYSLYAVNYHTGTPRSGHYWSACKNLDGHWYMFNDGDVSKCHSTSEIETKDAYVLMYHRKMIKNRVKRG